MNPFGTEESITVEGVSVKIPSLSGRSDSITFEKPRWMSDNEAEFCLNCNTKFSHLRRKHHCRNCGKIFCYKCCSEKMPLPHFGIKEPERICNICRTVVDLVWKLQTDDTAKKLEAIVGFSNLMKDAVGLLKVIECGGIHLMLSMATEEDVKIKCAIAAALHHITQNMTINSFLVEIGALKALKKLLLTSNGCDEIISDSLSALNSMSMDSNIRIQVLKEGIIDPLLGIISYTGTLAVFAAQILQILLSNFDCHEFIMQNHHHIIPRLFQALENEDYQMQACISKILVYFSAGSEGFRQIILQEDISREFPLIYLLKGSPTNILINVTCVVANLSLSIDENFAHHYISALCDLLRITGNETDELKTHLGRGLANFAENSANVLHLVHCLETIVFALLKSDFEISKFHACRLIICLLSSEPAVTFDILSQSGMVEFMEAYASRG